MADYFVQKQRSGDYRPEPKEMRHIQEVLQLLSVMTGDHRFEEVCSDEREGGPKTMCEVLDRVEKKGIAEGMEKGIAEGMEKGIAEGMEKGELKKAKETAFNLKAMGLTDEMIAKAVNVSLGLVRQWLGAAAAN